MSDATSGNTEQATYWEGRSRSWIEAEDWTGVVTGPFGRLAMDRLALRHGDDVLDVGCGTGPTTIEIARRVVPGGSALGVDIAPSMLDVARDRAERSGVERTTFRAADAQVDELPQVDAVFSQFGVMFFVDPAAAFANLHGALRDGGRIAFCCWQDLFSNEWMFVPGAAAMSVTGQPPPMPGPGEPGPFSLSEEGLAERLLVGAGFGDVEVVPHQAEVVVDEGRIDEVVSAASKVGAVREAMASTEDPAVREQIRSAVRDALRDRVDRGRLRLGSAAWIVSATA